MSGTPRFTLCMGALGALPLAQKLDAASAVGFDGVTVTLRDYVGARRDGLTDAQIVRMVRSAGLAIDYLDGITEWLPGVREPSSARIPPTGLPHDRVFGVAAELGTGALNAIETGGHWPGFELAVTAFASLCDEAARHGLRVSLEFTPIGAIPALDPARRIVEAAGRANGGLLLDSWHFKRGGSTLADLAALDPRRLFALQLSDTRAEPMADMIEETMHHRLPPGEGDAPIREIRDHLVASAAGLAVGVEIMSDALLALPPREAAARMLASAKRCWSEG